MHIDLLRNWLSDEHLPLRILSQTGGPASLIERGVEQIFEKEIDKGVMMLRIREIQAFVCLKRMLKSILSWTLTNVYFINVWLCSLCQDNNLWPYSIMIVSNFLKLPWISLFPALSYDSDPVESNLISLSITIHNKYHQAGHVLEFDKS